MEAEAAHPPAALRDLGLACLRKGDLDQAIDLLGQAVANDPGDHLAQLSLGIALQGKRRHSEALEPLDRARQARPNDAKPHLHASLSYLALGKAEAALQAANEACQRAPQTAQTHSAVGQALLALNEPARAEAAFATALQFSPRSADLWVRCGAARYRQGATDGAKAAMREALRHAPGHAVAKDNLDALLRLDGDDQPDRLSRLSTWKPKDNSASLGLAVEFLSRMPAFGRLQFGEWSQVLYYQVERGHFLFVVDQDRRVRGFLGWALTHQALAEQWVEGRAGLRNDQCREGDCVIINAFAAETAEANQLVVDTMRELFADKRTLYFKRHYPDGRTRPARLSVNRFVTAHLARSAARRVFPPDEAG
jgi:Tfp pilus assembly protein PilF/hemolysin-activating ACP:hemolysin acyltransferase